MGMPALPPLPGTPPGWPTGPGGGGVPGAGAGPSPDFRGQLQQQLTNFKNYYYNNFPEGLPQEAYEAIRDQHYDQEIAPILQDNGYGFEAGRDQWNQQTVRPGTSEYPRLKSFTAGALHSLTLGQVPAVEQYAAEAERSRQLAGTSGIWGGLGQMVGEMPAWTLGLGAASRIGQGMGAARALESLYGAEAAGGLGAAEGAGALIGTGKAAEAARATYGIAKWEQARLNMIFGGLTQGSMDAVRRENQDHRLMSGLGGFVMGAAGVGAFEAAGAAWAKVVRGSSLADYLMQNMRLDPQTALDVARVARGGMPNSNATRAVMEVPGILDGIRDWTQSRIFGARQAGVPKDTTVEMGAPPDQIRMDLRGADGQIYNLAGKTADFDQMMTRIVDHLNAGGSIENITANPTLHARFYQHLEQLDPDKLSFDWPQDGTDQRMGAGRIYPNDTIGPIKSPLGPMAGPMPRVVESPELVAGRESFSQELNERLRDARESFNRELQARLQSNAPLLNKVDNLSQALEPEVPAAPQAPHAVENAVTELREELQGASSEQLPDNAALLEKVRQLQESTRRTADMDAEELHWLNRSTESAAREAEQAAHEPDWEKLLRESIELAEVRKRAAQPGADPGLVCDSPCVPASPGFRQLWNRLRGKDTVTPEDIPEGDLPRPETEEVPVKDAPEWVRGSMAIGLDSQGFREAEHVGNVLAERGGVDRVVTSGLPRTGHTGMALSLHSGLGGQTEEMPDLQGWRGLEGELSKYAEPYKAALAREAPDTILHHTKYSTMPGESFNQFSRRSAEAVDQLLEYSKANPEARIVAVTHGSVLANIEAMAGKTLPFGRLRYGKPDVETFLKPREAPARMMKVEYGRPGEGIKVTPVGVGPAAAKEDLGPGVLLMRHGHTPLNPATEIRIKQTPLGPRGMAEDLPMGMAGVTMGTGPRAAGEPLVLYSKDAMEQSRMYRVGLITHESVHAHSRALNLAQAIREATRDAADAVHPSMMRDIYQSWHPETQAFYGQNPSMLNEEVLAFAGGAVRSGDQALLEAYGKADVDKDHVLDWVVRSADNIREKLGQLEPSIHRATFERRLDAIIARGTKQLSDINRSYDHLPGDVSFEDGHYVYRDAAPGSLDNGSTYRFTNRAGLADWLETQPGKPLTAQELVDTGALENVPRPAMREPAPNVQKPPTTTVPMPFESAEGSQPKAGLSFLSFFVRPFYGWLESVARLFKAPELFDSGYALRNAQTRMDVALEPYHELLEDTLGQHPRSRQADLLTYLRASDATKPNVANDLRLSSKELESLEKFRIGLGPYREGFENYLQNTLKGIEDSGYNLSRYRMRANQDPRQMGFGIEPPDAQVVNSLLGRGLLDPKEPNAIKVAATYLRGALEQEHLTGPLEDFDKEIHARTIGPDGKGQDKYGILVPLLERHLEHMQGMPDLTQKAIASGIDAVTELYNKGVAAANEHLPDWMQLKPLEWTAQEALDKYIRYSYASALSLKPGIIVRDALQLFTTTLPILGAKYTAKGMKEAWPALREGAENTWYKQAMDHGVILAKNNMHELYAGGPVAAEGATEKGVLGATVGRLEKLGEKGMSYIQSAHNSNRVTAFVGHTLKAEDAIQSFMEHQNIQLLEDESDLWFLPELVRKRFTREIDNISRTTSANPQPGDYADVSRRIAKDLVDATQWEYRRGAGPGFSKWQIGRLFGQYGTYPANYVEYARRMLQNGGWQRGMSAPGVKALTRLAVAHGAVLAGGAAAGIDTSKWVFAGPAAYSGGPILQTTLELPHVFSGTPEGAEARRDLIETIGPAGLIPGVDEGLELYHGVTTNDPNYWVKALGFTPRHR